MEGALHRVGLPDGALVELLEVDDSARLPVIFYVDHHPTAPCRGDVGGDLLQHAELSSPAFTSSWKWIGTGDERWQATGFADLSMKSFRGGLVFTKGRACSLQLLNVEDLYLSWIHCLIFLMLSSVAGYGQVVGVPGGSSLVGHLHVLIVSALLVEVEYMPAGV